MAILNNISSMLFIWSERLQRFKILKSLLKEYYTRNTDIAYFI